MVDADGIQGLSHQAIGCAKCGFGFLFQLLEDYMPHPNAGLVACDSGNRVLASGQGVFELTGRVERDMLGRDVAEALALRFADGDPIATAHEWGVRQLGKRATARHVAGHEKAVIVDVFPAYDDDGGLLVAVAPDDGRG